VEITLQRVDQSVIETRNAPVVPATLGPGERGRFDFEYSTEAGVFQYVIGKLTSNGKQIFFSTNKK
jgi:hypothetical protein